MTKVELIKDPHVFFDYLTSDEINMLHARFVSDEMIEIHCENNENFIAPNAKTNVVIAAFTTVYARLKLYGMLDMLQERVLYYDTDSVIFVSKPNDRELPIGPYPGELTDELGGNYITAFVSGGPKNYSFFIIIIIQKSLYTVAYSVTYQYLTIYRTDFQRAVC